MPLYVYALTGSGGPAFDAAGQRVEFVDLGGIFAAASTRDALPPLSEATLRDQHDIVGAIAGLAEAVLPARFGSLVEPAELARVVGLRRAVLEEAVALVRGREQMTIRVFAVPAEAPPAASPAPASGTEYLAQRKAATEVTLSPGAHALIDAVGHLVVAERVVRGEGRVVATLYHLVRRGASPEYAGILERMRGQAPDLPFIVSGPWPPFAFAPELLS